MPILHYMPASVPCRIVLLLGRVLNIEFDLRVIDLMKGDQLKPEFVEVWDELVNSFYWFINKSFTDDFYGDCLLYIYF